MAKVPVVVLGATGMVGQRALTLLVDHPWLEVVALCASERSAGRPYSEAVRWNLEGEPPLPFQSTVVQTCDAKAITTLVGRPGIALSALDRRAATEIELDFARHGWSVVSNASSHRADPRVPLIVPEINADHLALADAQPWPGRIVTNPNCVAIPLSLSLAPLLDLGLEAAVVSTWQAVSGAGYPGESAWDMVGNAHPHSALSEEAKTAAEPRKILATLGPEGLTEHPISISARCVRVPVADGHLVGVSLRTTRPVSPEEAIQRFTSWDPGLGLPSAPEPVIVHRSELDRPSARKDAGTGRGMALSVGRVEACPIMGLKYYALAHNTIRGAAGAALLNAELLVQTGRVT